MSDQPTTPEKPPSAVIRSQVERKRRLSLIWAIPVITALVGAYLAWQTLTERGPLITITFETAEGLQAGQSHVRHKDVDMGTVQKIALSRDLQHVVVTVRMNKEAEPLLTDKTQFWVVKPRFFAGSISGLQTLISGAYIEMLPSTQTGVETTSFSGLETPPVLQSDVPGRTFLLKAPRLASLNLGSPVMFRDLTVGEVLGWDLGEMAENVTIHAFVRAPYDKYVHDNSRFWNASGASVKLGANGLQLQLESLRALVLGGIAFETPNQGRGAPPSEDKHVFSLYADKEAADSASFARTVKMLAVFHDSVGGLAVGAPVTVRGIKIGSVDSVDLVYNNRTDRVDAPVHFTVEPERIHGFHLPSGADEDAAMQALLRKGLRVRLESTSLITGQKQLSLDVVGDGESAPLVKHGDTYVLPAQDGGGDLASSASALLAKVSDIPFEQIGKNLNETLAGANALVSDPQLKQAVASLQATLTSAQALLANVNQGVGPVLKKLPGVANGLDDAVKRADRLLTSLDNGYGANSSFNRDISRLLAQLSDTARSVRSLADLLNRHPEALLRGR